MNYQNLISSSLALMANRMTTENPAVPKSNSASLDRSNSRPLAARPLQFAERAVGTTQVVSVSGVIDYNTSPVLREFLCVKSTSQTPELLLDLSGVACVDSTALATFLESLKAARGFGGSLALTGLTPRVRGAFEIMQLENIFDLHVTVAAGLAALRREESEGVARRGTTDRRTLVPQADTSTLGLAS